jgi:predicted Fe-S protein YdhL (DUF1289 family)
MSPNSAPVSDEKTAPTPAADESTTPSQLESQATSPCDGGARAWLCVLGAFVGLFATFGQISSFGTYQAYYTTHAPLAGHSPSTIAWIGSVQLWMWFFSVSVLSPCLRRCELTTHLSLGCIRRAAYRQAWTPNRHGRRNIAVLLQSGRDEPLHEILRAHPGPGPPLRIGHRHDVSTGLSTPARLLHVKKRSLTGNSRSISADSTLRSPLYPRTSRSGAPRHWGLPSPARAQAASSFRS